MGSPGAGGGRARRPSIAYSGCPRLHHVKPTPPPADEPARGDGSALAWEPVGPPEDGLGVYVLADPDALLLTMDDDSFRANDEKMPYYALLWPTGAALACAVLASSGWAGKRVLDLGCGVAPEGLAAALRGARLTCLDWAPEAEALVRRSAVRLGVALERFVAADWRSPPTDLGRFDRILGADVLYEARNAEPVARFLAAHLEPDGEAWLADPGRLHARTFPEQAALAGLALLEARPLPTTADGATVTLWRYARI
jgi:predicted nicotinamide N-methyase